MNYTLNPAKTGAAAPVVAKAKQVSDVDILKALEGYISIHNSLWDHVPIGSHLRYFKKDAGQKLSKLERYRSGSFLKSKFEKDGKKMFLLETEPNGSQKNPKYKTFPVAYEDIEELWKKYDRHAFLEIHLINISLAEKKRQITELNERVHRLEQIVQKLVNFQKNPS